MVRERLSRGIYYIYNAAGIAADTIQIIIIIIMCNTRTDNTKRYEIA